MLKNYFKTAIRSFLKNKVITIITVLGLSIGISAALVIYQIVQYDYSFDKYEPDGNRIYRIVSEGENWKNSGVPAPLHEAVQNKIAGITTTAAFFEYNYTKVSIPQKNGQPPNVFKKQEDIVFAGKNYFSIFPHQWLAGNAATSLKAPYQLVLSESRAKLYFPGLSISQIMGQRVIFNDTINAVVSGIVRDLNAATDFDHKAFIALSTIPHSGLKRFFNWEKWGSINGISQLFVKLVPGISPKQINKQIATIFKVHPTGYEYMDNAVHRLQPLSDIHFNTDFGGPANKSTLRNLILLDSLCYE